MKDVWDLSVLCPDEESFLKGIEEMKALKEEMASYQGKLGEHENLAAFLRLEIKANELISRIYMFASMRADRDRRVTENNQDEMRVMLALQEFSSALSFEEPEIIALGEDYIKGFLEKNPEFSQFDYSFRKLFRGQDHVLSVDKEKLLSDYRPLVGEGRNLYSMLSISDFKPRKAKLSDGRELEVTQANWTTLIEDAKLPEDRQAIFEALYANYEDHKNTYGEIYNAVVQGQLSVMRSRGYSSILNEHLHDNAIPEDVFLSLIEVASKGSEPLKRYYELKRKYFGLEKFRSYDRFLKLAESEKKYTYEEAKQLFFDSLKDYPEDYQKKAREVLKEGYVDVYPGDGKRSGAYSNGGDNIHPFILLNYMGRLEDVFTLAHESGHSVHTLYSMEAQPLIKQGYTIFVAEIASTFNEHNLLDYLMKSGELSKKDKIALLQKAIDEICGTFYRQTLFGHYEYEISKLAEAGQPINHQVLSNKMIELYKTYYGIDIAEEKVKPLVWAYIPHLFRTPFYVYQYATSFTASMLFYERVKNGEKNAWEDYLKLLRSGGSDDPVQEILASGVDLTKKEVFEAVVHRMDDLVNELETLLQA